MPMLCEILLLHGVGALAAAGAPVALPTGQSTTLVVTPSARVSIPPGRFVMGASPADLRRARDLCRSELRRDGALALDLGPRCTASFDGEAPAVEVFVPAFSIDRTEVTVGAYTECVRARACPAVVEQPTEETRALPVEGVTFAEAQAFCRFRKGRLPTEAEWEKAARGQGARLWPWGDVWDARRSNHGRAEHAQVAVPGEAEVPAASEPRDASDGFLDRAPVGSFRGGASVYGPSDLAGNVWEWTSGYFAREPPQSSARFDPRGPAFGVERTVRGGSYRSPPSDLRVTRRRGMNPHDRALGVGFRCAYEAEKAPPGSR